MRFGLYGSIANPPRGEDLDSSNLPPDHFILGDAETCVREFQSGEPEHEKIKRLGDSASPLPSRRGPRAWRSAP